MKCGPLGVINSLDIVSTGYLPIGRIVHHLLVEQPTTLVDNNNQQLPSRTGKLMVESVGRTSYLLVPLGRTTHHVDGQEQSTVTE